MSKIYLAKADTDKLKKDHVNPFNIIGKFLAKSDDGQNSSDTDKGDMLDGKNDCEAVEVVDNGGSLSGNPAKPGDGLASGDLDTDTKKVGSHTVVPPYNKDASPETDPDKKVGDYDTPSREEMTPSATENTGGLDPKLQYQVKSADTDPEFTMIDEGDDCKASEAIWSSIAYISQDERDKVSEEDFAGPHKSFPIRNGHDVQSATKLVGHGKNPTAIKRKIIEIAKRKGLTHALPDSWKGPDEHSSASVYEQALALMSKLSPEERKSLADKLSPEETAVNPPQE